MKGGDVLRQQFGLVYGLVRANTAGMDAEASLVQPKPAGNCANWVLGHLTAVHNAVMWLGNETPVWDSALLRLRGALHGRAGASDRG